jgi:hypothetical protein
VSFYPGAYAFGAAAVVLLVRWRSLGRRGWLYAAGALLVAALCALVMAIPYLQVRDEQPGFHRTLADLPALAADFLSTDPRLSVWGSLLGKGTGWPIYGEPAFPGIVLLVLAPIGAIAGWRARGRERRTVVVGAALTVVGAALAIGAGPSGWRRYAPYRLLFEYVPGWEALRAAGRAWVVGLLGVGLFAGLGVLATARALARHSSLALRTATGTVAAVAVVVLLIEGFSPWTGRPDIRVSPVDEHLAAIHRPGGVLYLPALETGGTAAALSGFRQAENVYGTTAHHRDTPNGYSGYFPPSWVALSKQMRELPDAAAIERLRALGIRFVVLRDWARGGTWDALLDPERARPLRLVGQYGPDLLYEVPAGGS